MKIRRIENPKKKIRVNTKTPQKFRDCWLKEADFRQWLIPDPGNIHKAKCKLCNTSFTAQIVVIRNHAKSNARLKFKSSTRQEKIDSFVHQHASTSSSIDNSVKRAEIKLCGFMVEHNLSFRVMDHMTDLLKSCFRVSKISENVQLKSTKTAAVIKNVLGESQKENLCDKLKKIKFSRQVNL